MRKKISACQGSNTALNRYAPYESCKTAVSKLFTWDRIAQKTAVYLRSETAQGIFSNCKQVIDSSRVKLPFGIAQLGKSFRNEITTGQFVFRTLEFEQGEIEYFFDPRVTDWELLLEEWKETMWRFVSETLGVNPENLRWRRHSDKERSFYSKETYDLDYRYPFGFKELWGVAYRTDYDMQQHIDHSGKKLHPKQGSGLCRM